MNTWLTAFNFRLENIQITTISLQKLSDYPALAETHPSVTDQVTIKVAPATPPPLDLFLELPSRSQDVAESLNLIQNFHDTSDNSLFGQVKTIFYYYYYYSINQIDMCRISLNQILRNES